VKSLRPRGYCAREVIAQRISAWSKQSIALPLGIDLETGAPVAGAIIEGGRFEWRSRSGGKVKVEGSYTFDAPRDRVWTMLMNPDALKNCVPGLESLTPTGENAYEAALKVGVGAIRGNYKSTISLTDIAEPSSYKMNVEGKGGSGFVKGVASIELAEQGEQTVLNVVGDGNVGGPVAGVGQRMLGGVAKMLMGQFFDCLKKQL